MNMKGVAVRRAQVSATDAAEAVSNFHAAVHQPDMALVLFFCSPEYDLDIVAAEMVSRFGDVPVAGCTTAGEIGPAGYTQGTLSGLSFPSSKFAASCGCLGSLGDFDNQRGRHFVQGLLQDLESRSPGARPDQTFAFQMIDGLCVREEPVTRTFQAALGPIALVGGSAGDGLNFARTRVYWKGRFHADSAVLAVISTPLRFRPLMAQHFIASDRRVVVTAADTANRIVHQIDGRPAAEVYAELVGVATDNLDPMRFAAYPMAVRIGGVGYVRSISKALPDGSLKFFCAIDEGMVLRVSKGADLVGNLERTFAALEADIGPPQVIIGCDCILRRVEIETNGLKESVAAVLERNRVVGFNTYGEQYRGVHVNQTFAGIAIADTEAAHP